MDLREEPFLSLSPCEQALWGTLAAERENEGNLASTSLESEYLHRKSIISSYYVPDGGASVSIEFCLY